MILLVGSVFSWTLKPTPPPRHALMDVGAMDVASWRKRMLGSFGRDVFGILKRRVCLTYSENTVDNDGHFCIHMYILYDSIMLKSIIILFAQSSRSPSRPPRQNNHIVDHDLASSNGPQAWEQVDIKLIIALVKGFFLFTFFSPVNSQNPPGEKTRTSSVAGRWR